MSDLPEMTFYRDKRCEELEGVLRESPDYEGCTVKRFKQLEEFQEQGDPFDIKDSAGKHLVWLYEHEVDTLDDSELLVFATVQREYEQKSESIMKWQVLAICLLFAGIVCVSTTWLLGLMFTSFSPLFPVLFPVSVLILLCGTVLFQLYLRGDESRKKESDIKYISENPSLLSALRKLAPLSDPKNKFVEDYSKRLRAVENEMSGI